MYRAYFFVQMPGKSFEDGIRMTSQGVQTYQEACAILDELHKFISPNASITGGDIERMVDGPGWCLCDHEKEINHELGDDFFM